MDPSPVTGFDLFDCVDRCEALCFGHLMLSALFLQKLADYRKASVIQLPMEGQPVGLKGVRGAAVPAGVRRVHDDDVGPAWVVGDIRSGRVDRQV